jgi:Mesyanzhinovviridae DNA helicase
MIELDPTRFKTKPFAHQLEGIKALLKYPAFALFDEMGAGKSKQVVDAACTLHVAGEINVVLIVCPAAVRSVWTSFETGQIKTHGWVASKVLEFHTLRKGSNWHGVWQDDRANLWWVVTNYEFLRSLKNRNTLTDALRGPGRKPMLVLDESSYVKSQMTEQATALEEIRKWCGRCVLLNGTPVTDSPLDLWSQLHILDKTILGGRYKNFYHFKAVHGVMGGFMMKKIVKWKNLDQLSELIKPRVLRRLKADCLDLPPKLYTEREVALTPESWKRYQELKRDALIHLSETDVQLEPNSAVRIMRLAQLTSGHLGGGIDQDPYATDNDPISMKDLSDEKLRWCVEHVASQTSNAIIVWCRWRRERERLVILLRELMLFDVYELHGGQSKNDRESAVKSFTVAGGHRRILVAQPHAGGYGLNLIAATQCVYLSNDFSLGIRLQSEDRCHRPGQNSAVTYVDVLATGPQGQRTVDHVILKALRAKEELARWTTSRWRKELGDES